MKRPPFLVLLLLLAQVAAALLLLIALCPTLKEGPRIAAAPPRPAPPPAPAKPASAVILCYHAISKKPNTPYVTSVSDFTKQMEWLAQKHYRVVPVSQLVGYYAGHQPLPDSTVAITFDDGYESVFTEAWPVLKQHGFPFSIFIYPSYIGHGKGSMSWRQVIAADSAGVEVESHSMTHPVLTHTQGKSDADYRKWLARELKGSRDTLERRLGHPVDLLAYPFGAFDRAVEDAAKAAGYRACFLVDAGVNDSATSVYQLDRVIISRNFPFPLFQTILATHSVELGDVRPYPGEEAKASRNLDISVRIDNYKELVPSSIRIMVSKGHGKALVDTSAARARFLLDQPLKKGFHEAAVYARNKHGERCVGCWMFLVRE